ncbi:MAG: hypothetical protein BGN85_08955 [Alphaproteobacteria bacterium 64-11]|nr:MAG: hypothetical protein BGN85_08955 [Alphaproteobacteria bacterium 64-11]
MRQSHHLGTFTGEAYRHRGRAKTLVMRDDLPWLESFTATGILVFLAGIGGTMLAITALRAISLAVAHAHLAPAVLP